MLLNGDDYENARGLVKGALEREKARPVLEQLDAYANGEYTPDDVVALQDYLREQNKMLTTRKRAIAAVMLPQGKTHAEVADVLDVGRGAVSQLLKGR